MESVTISILLTVIGILCILYGITVRMAGSGTMFFAVWLVLGCGFLVLAALIKHRVFSCIPKPFLAVLSGIVLVWFLSVCIFEAVIIHGFSCELPDHLDYLIVLGAQVREDGPSTVLTYRLDEAADYMIEHPDCRCIVSGGRGYNEPTTEAEAMKIYLIGRGIDGRRILVEDQAENTVQNIQFSKEFLESPDAAVGIVTNNFHMPRALAIARKQGLTNVHGLPAPSDPVFLVNNMLREYFGMMKDLLAGNL